MSRAVTAIIGAGPYGLSLAAHLAARGIEHRIFGTPMLFWSKLAEAGGERYLKSYCFGANISTPRAGFSFADYSEPRGLETFEPCSIENFASYGRWFQQQNVPWVEPVDVAYVERHKSGFEITLANNERFAVARVVLATGLERFAHMPNEFAALTPTVVTHTSRITRFAAFRGREVAVVGSGQSALEAAALLYEAGASPHLLARKDAVLWQHRVVNNRNLWRRLRSPISGLGTGPKAWALTQFPGLMHHVPDQWRTRFVRNHLPPEGAWWLRERVEKRIPIYCGTTVSEACTRGSRAHLRLRTKNGHKESQLTVDHVVAGTGYCIDVERLDLLSPKLRNSIRRIDKAPRLNTNFQSSVCGLYFIGPAAAMSFGPLFRFVVGAEHTAQVVSAHLTS